MDSLYVGMQMRKTLPPWLPANPIPKRRISRPEGKLGRVWGWWWGVLLRMTRPRKVAPQVCLSFHNLGAQSSTGPEDSLWGGRKWREKSEWPSRPDLWLSSSLRGFHLVFVSPSRKEENKLALPHHWDHRTGSVSCFWLHLWWIRVEAG